MLHVTIVTPFGMVYDGEAEEVCAPGFEGEFGVLDNHIPFLTRGREGVASLMIQGKKTYYAVGQSFIEVGPNKVLILAESALTADQIEREKVEADLAAAEKRLAESDLRLDDPVVDRIKHDIGLAQARLKVIGMH